MSGRMRWCKSPGQIELDHSDAEGLICGYQQITVLIYGNIFGSRCSNSARIWLSLLFKFQRCDGWRDKRVDATKLNHTVLIECNHIRPPGAPGIGVAFCCSCNALQNGWAAIFDASAT